MKDDDDFFLAKIIFIIFAHFLCPKKVFKSGSAA